MKMIFSINIHCYSYSHLVSAENRVLIHMTTYPLYAVSIVIVTVEIYIFMHKVHFTSKILLLLKICIMTVEPSLLVYAYNNVGTISYKCGLIYYMTV